MDYRAFLAAHVQDMKRRRAHWTYGSWAKALDLKTTSSITKIIQGQRDPGPDIARKLVAYFKFSRREADYFMDLLRLQRVKDDPRLTVLLMEKMSKEHPKGSIRILDDKAFSVISNWYCLPLRELIRKPSFVEDADLIARIFRFKVTPREIAQAIRAMESVGVLIRDSKGRLKPAEGRIDTQNEVASEAIKRYHESMLEHARNAVRTMPVDHRELTSSTILIRRDNLKAAKEMIRTFKKKFSQVFEDTSAEEVYQIQIQLFPITKEG